MDLYTIRALALVIALLPPVAQAQNQTPPALTFTQLTEAATLKTSSGATFTVANGWHVAQGPTLIVIQEPEKELAAAFVERRGLGDAGGGRVVERPRPVAMAAAGTE